MKKIEFNILSICFLISTFLCQPVFADTSIVVAPKTKITTSNQNLKEGDYLDFVVNQNVFLNNKLLIKQGSIVEGMVTYLEPNTWGGDEAKLTIEQFVTRDIHNKRIKLVGNVYKEGNRHEGYLAFFRLWLIRGGEVQIKPEKDRFNLFVKESL